MNTDINSINDTEVNIVTKGIEGEQAFINFLNEERIGFYKIDQSIDSYPETFKLDDGTIIKRPDFIIFFVALSETFVEVKNITLTKNPVNGVFEATICCSDVEKLIAFENACLKRVWYAVREENSWLWLRVADVVPNSKIRTNRVDKSQFYAIPRHAFREITSRASLVEMLTETNFQIKKAA